MAEHLVGRAGKLLAAPVGATTLISVSTHLTTGVTLTDDVTPVEPGIHHATKWLDGYGDKAGVQSVDENRQALGALQVLYTWILCNGDHQLIYSNSSPPRVASVDHTDFLPGGAGAWTAQALRDHASAVQPDQFFDQAALIESDRHPALRALARVREEGIARIVAGPPAVWGLDMSDRVALAEYLWARRDRVLAVWPEATK